MKRGYGSTGELRTPCSPQIHASKPLLSGWFLLRRSLLSSSSLVRSTFLQLACLDTYRPIVGGHPSIDIEVPSRC